MSAFTARVKLVWRWLAEARHAWLALSVILLALIFTLRPNTTEPAIRITGLVLQLLGIGTVVWGISETRALFGHLSFPAKVRGWLRRSPLVRRNIVLAASSGSLHITSGKVRASVTANPVNDSVEARLDALEKNLSHVNDRVTGVEREMDEGFRSASSEVKSEAVARHAEDEVLRQRLEAAGTGGIHISSIGALWLFVGVVLSTASPEIAQLLK